MTHKCVVILLVHLNLVILCKRLLFHPKPNGLHITVFSFPIVTVAGVTHLPLFLPYTQFMLAV